MIDFLIDNYLVIKSLHIIFVISWMAGLFYLPRLFVYHTRVDIGSDQDKLFQLMERKLLRVIMNPAMILSWLFGIMLFSTPGIALWESGWVIVKLAGVFAMTVFHMVLVGWRKRFELGQNTRPEKFYRMSNEVPTLLMFVIVFMAVMKPF